MTVPHIEDETHGNIRWFRDYGPVPVENYEGECQHRGQSVIAWGWDRKHYELVECGINGKDCGSRAWSDERGRITTPWMQPKERGDQA
ncbi:hypothetical protein AB0O52_17555 [Arthrobacter sp. NPDC080073]|uniref:hypothetical protein n=1 Tax=Arthrobacter sp. NPDC080073 TaxID=3155919 RepID=UPI003423558A